MRDQDALDAPRGDRIDIDGTSYTVLGVAGSGSRTADLDRRTGARMRLDVEFSPDLVALLEQEIKAGERAVTAAMKSAGPG